MSKNSFSNKYMRSVEDILAKSSWPLPFLMLLAVIAFFLPDLHLLGIDVSFIPVSLKLLKWSSLVVLFLCGVLLITRRSFTPPPPYYSCLEDYWCAKLLSEEAYDIIIEAIQNDNNILITGKEDVNKWNFARLTRVTRKMTRTSPDRAIFGDISNSDSALTMLQAWTPRKPSGLATITARSAKDGLEKIEKIITHDLLKLDPSQETIQSFSGTYSIQDVIAEKVDLVVYIAHLDNQPESTVSEIISVKGFDHDTQEYITEHVYYDEPQQY